MSIMKAYTEQIFDPTKMSSLLLSSMLKKLNNSERELRTLTDNISDVLVRFDHEGRIVYVNQRFHTLFGIGISAVRGKKPTQIPDLPDSRLFEQVVLRVVQTKEKESFEHELREENGNVLTGLVRVTPEFDAEGNVQYVQILTRDITEQKQHEKQLAAKELEFRSLAENTPDNIARWDTEGRYLYINPTHERLLGMTLSEAIGTFIPNTHSNVKEAIAQVAATGEKTTISQTALVGGNIVYHEVSIVPERDASGNIISILGLGRDMTEYKRVEEALRKALELNEEIISAIPDLLFELDAEGTYLNIWAQDEALLAAQKSNLLGKNIQEVLPPDALEVAIETMRDVDETGHTSGHCYCLDLPVGKKWFELSASKKKSSGTYIILSRDISERKNQ